MARTSASLSVRIAAAEQHLLKELHTRSLVNPDDPAIQSEFNQLLGPIVGARFGGSVGQLYLRRELAGKTIPERISHLERLATAIDGKIRRTKNESIVKAAQADLDAVMAQLTDLYAKRDAGVKTVKQAAKLRRAA